MNKKRKWFLFLIGVLLVSSACNLVSYLSNPVDEAVSEIEELADQIDIEEIEQELETLTTGIPSNLDELPNLDDIGNLGDLGDLDATVQALQEGFGSDEVPPDIPVVDEQKEILFGSKDTVSYSTPMELDDVIAFYQDEMPSYDWKPKENGTVIQDGAAVLQFEKPGRDAIVTMSKNQDDGLTYVMIIIQPR